MSILDPFIPTYVTLFVIVDPLGTAAVFLGLTRDYTAEELLRTARKAALIALGLMAAFGLLGQTALHILSITLPAFRVAGGLLLFVTAYRMVMGHHEQSRVAANDSVYRDRSDIAVFPLAIPLLCGPGGMTAAILLFNRPDGWPGKAAVLLGIVAVQATAYLCLRYAPRLQEVIGKTGIGILARVMGVVLSAMAVQFIVNGLLEIRAMVPA